MVYGIIGMINFAHGDIFMVGSFIALATFLALLALGISALPLILFITLLVSMLFTSAWGWTVERLAYRPLRGSFRLAALIMDVSISPSEILPFPNIGVDHFKGGCSLRQTDRDLKKAAAHANLTL